MSFNDENKSESPKFFARKSNTINPIKKRAQSAKKDILTNITSCQPSSGQKVILSCGFSHDTDV